MIMASITFSLYQNTLYFISDTCFMRLFVSKSESASFVVLISFHSLRLMRKFKRLILFEPRHETTLYCHMRTTRRKSARASTQSDQRLYFRCLDSTIALLAIAELS